MRAVSEAVVMLTPKVKATLFTPTPTKPTPAIERMSLLPGLSNPSTSTLTRSKRLARVNLAATKGNGGTSETVTLTATGLVPRNTTATSREASVSHSALPSSPLMRSDSIVRTEPVTRRRGRSCPRYSRLPAAKTGVGRKAHDRSSREQSRSRSRPGPHPQPQRRGLRHRHNHPGARHPIQRRRAGASGPHTGIGAEGLELRDLLPGTRRLLAGLPQGLQAHQGLRGDARLAELPFPYGRRLPAVPHLTLGRVQRGADIGRDLRR